MKNLENLHRRWADGKPTLNALLTIPSPWSAEIMAHAGYDVLTLDMQHGLIDYATALGMLQAMAPTTVVPMVRLRWNDPAHIMQVLDAGAQGVICPMIHTAADVRTFVSACRYPPRGSRSFGPLRARLYSEADYFTTANDRVLAFAMIETAASVDNLAAIAATPELDGLFVGPYDLSVSLGLERIADVHDPELRQVLDRVLELCNRHNLVPGIYTGSPEHATFLATLGFRLVTLGHDTALLEGAAKEQIGLFGF